MSDEEKRFVLRQTEDVKKREQIHETTVLQIYVATYKYTRTCDYHHPGGGLRTTGLFVIIYYRVRWGVLYVYHTVNVM